MGVLALVLAILTLATSVSFVEVAVLATLLGIVNCFNNPAQQSFVLEMVGPDQLRNAVSLNSTLVNAARAVGLEHFNLDLIYGAAGETLEVGDRGHRAGAVLLPGL